MIKAYLFLVKLPLVSIAMFFICFIIASFIFPGSEIESINYTSDRYSLSHNFLSGLGGLETSSGKSNLISAILFNSSLVFLGVVLVLFYIQFKEVFHKLNDSSKAIFYARTSAPIGVVAGVLYAGVGAVPYDVHLGLHVFFAKYAFLTLFFLSVSHILTIYHSKYISSKYAAGHALFCVALIFYIYMLFFGPSITSGSGFSESDLMLQVISQKSIVFTFIISILIQVYGFHQVLRVHK
jgi:hypothetical protein